MNFGKIIRKWIRMRPLLLTILICLPLTVFAQETQELQQEGSLQELSQEVYESISVNLEVERERRSGMGDEETKASPKLSKEEVATFFGIVYVGMPKEDLAKAGYTELLQKGYRKDGNEEWITYLNWANPNSDRVTFYLKDGKVKGWEER